MRVMTSGRTRMKEKHPTPHLATLPRPNLGCGKGSQAILLSYAAVRCLLLLYPRSSPVSYKVEFTEEIKGHGAVEKSSQKWPVVRRVSTYT